MVSNAVTEQREKQVIPEKDLVEETEALESSLNTDDDDDIDESSLWNKIQEKIGQVDESRLIFPEYESGQVPKLYSTLQYTQDATTGRVVAEHTTGSVVQAAALMAAAALGPGLVAVPAATAPIGYVTSAVAYVPAFLYMTISGLLLAELQLNRMAATTGKQDNVQLPDLIQLGPPVWTALATASWWAVQYVLLLFCLMQGSQVLSSSSPVLLDNSIGLNLETPALTAAMAVGATALGAVRQSAGVLLGVSMLALAATAAQGLPSIDWSLLMANQHPEQVLNCLPVLFMSLVVQGMIPQVVTLLEGNRQRIQTAIVAGTAVPFASVLVWNALVTGQATDSWAATLLLGTALTGSAVQLTQSLAASWKSVWQWNSDDNNNNNNNTAMDTLAALALAMGPPAVLATTMDDSTAALEWAGAFGASTLFLVLTPIMAWKERYSVDTPLVTKPMVPLGKLPLGSMWKAAATLIVEQGAEKLGVFEYIQHVLFQQ